MMPECLQLSLPLRLHRGLGFSNFEAGRNSELVARLQSVSLGGGGQLYFWGEAGSGRTHLMQATLEKAQGAGLQVCYLPCTELLSLPTTILQGLETQALVLVDDLDALAGMSAWEEALFHLYNRLQESNVTLVLSAKGPPVAIGLELDDLKSRLAAGEVFRIRPLLEDELVRLFCLRAGERGLVVTPEVGRYVISRVERTAAATMSLLDRLDNAALSEARRLTIPFVKQILQHEQGFFGKGSP